MDPIFTVLAGTSAVLVIYFLFLVVRSAIQLYLIQKDLERLAKEILKGFV